MRLFSLFLDRLVGFLVHKLKQLFHVDAVHHAGFFHRFAAGRRAAKAVHPDGKKDRRSLRRKIKNFTDDGVFCNFNHGSIPPKFDGNSLPYFSHIFNRKYKEKRSVHFSRMLISPLCSFASSPSSNRTRSEKSDSIASACAWRSMPGEITRISFPTVRSYRRY